MRSFGFGTVSPRAAPRWTGSSRWSQRCCATATSTSSSAGDGHLLEVTINRPEARNSLHPAANEELDHVFDAYFADRDLWVAILTGAGDKAFSAGNDLVYSASGQPVWVPKNGFAGRPAGATAQARHRRRQRIRDGRRLRDRARLPPRLADSTAQFALSEVRVGLVAGAGGVVRLPRTIPPRVATEMILTGRRITAAEALGYGLVNRVVPAGFRWKGRGRSPRRSSTAHPRRDVSPCS